MNPIYDYNDINSENDFYEDYGDYEVYQGNDEIYFFDVWRYCGLLSVQSILPLVIKLLVSNAIFGIILPNCKSESCFHLVSGGVGVYLISEVKSFEGKYIIVIYFLISYFVLLSSQYVGDGNRKRLGIFAKLALIGSLIFSEYLLIDPAIFLQIRGILMVLIMKVLSLVDETVERKTSIGILQYFGYSLCCANILFGPWITFREYLGIHSTRRRKDIFWILGICKSLILALLCLTVSNCWSTYLIPDESNRWLLAYRDALAFRYSHYFVSYMAESGMIAAGFKNPTLKDGSIWSYTIVSPMEVEFPTSLSVVVTKWNGPMHLFLKNSIYQPTKRYGQFAAIMATFLISSFLHGLEVKVSVVLLSLGLFSYLQAKARTILSSGFSACVKIKSCKQCNHKYKRDHWAVKISLILFSFTSIIHLAYLGILMDPQSNDISIYEKWNNLYFIGHVIMFFNLILII
ncbi:hypothetical protein WA026_013041 [Henosepilachna vigintioctopunctata]|uniref:Protein-serine O-palmitoleoyltransferase porcupine n=1 Tax=Henosepilachna vigintioctopunctata TaxID=420089 RepID=A0AAW1UJK6_9CUCU